MVFSSMIFIFAFLPIVLLGYLIINKLFKNNTVNNLFLSTVSLVFYWWGGGGRDVLLIVYLIIANYIFGIILKAVKKPLVLVVPLAVNLLFLIKFKYPHQFIKLLKTGEDPLKVIIPLGMSFIIFHCISYLIDTYREEKDLLKNRGLILNQFLDFIDFSTYILFFPKLIQGPIVRYSEMKEELRNRIIDFNNVIQGTERFALGLAKKVLIADELGRLLYNMVSLSKIDSLTAFVTIIIYAFQLYIDFSAYSDMAIGISGILGFNFKENFNFPYRSKSVSEFWRRWHISLGSFFREYVYFPLGGSRRGNVYFNLFVVFLLTGIWHGNTLIYLFWGLFHGFFVLLEKTKIFSRLLEKTPVIIRIMYTNIVVWLGWLAFRLPDWDSFRRLFSFIKGSATRAATFSFSYFMETKYIVILVVCFIGSFLLNEGLLRKIKKFMEKNIILITLKYILILFLFVVSYSAMISKGFSPFLYFQF